MSINGTWFAVEAPLTFLFQQQDALVLGTFHDEKTFTCELRGSLVGNRLSFNFETAWSWLNVHEIGSAALDLSADGARLSGPVLIGGKPGRWTLTRTKAVERPRPPPTPVVPPSYVPPVRRGGGGGGGGGGGVEGFRSYRDRIVKQVSEGFNDPVLMDRLKKRADVEPELRELLERRHVIPPRKRP